MNYPCYCALPLVSCIDSRLVGGYRRRRYECDRCGARWTTAEIFVAKAVPGRNMTRRMIDEALAHRADSQLRHELQSLKAKLRELSQ